MILIGNGPVITRDDRKPFIPCGAVLIKDNQIIDIGPWLSMKEKYSSRGEEGGTPDIEVMDIEGKLLMPGLINAHHHIYSAYARGLILPEPSPETFMDILENVWWKIDRHLALKHTYYSGIATYIESIQNGVTTVVDHHASYKEVTGSLNKLAESAQKVGIRTCLAYEVSDRDGHSKMKEAVKENLSFLSGLQDGNHMITGLVGLHASFTLSDDSLNYIKKENHLDHGYHVHIGESITDETHCQSTYDCSVVERLYKHKILGENTLAGHCIHVSDKDLALLKESQTKVIYNPESNMANGVGSPDILKMIDQGILVGLGTDGYTCDMLESVKVANILQKHHHQKGDRGFVEAADILFKNNAKIVSHLIGQTVGTIKKGALADLVVMNYNPTTPLNETNYNGHILFGMQGAMADTTIVNGQVIYKNREFVNLEHKQLLSDSRQAAEDFWRELQYE